jgi:hypothetical protein
MGWEMSKYISFPEFRDHEAVRVQVNAAIMGLLAGSQMAVHLLEQAERSEDLLTDIFPQIPHIKRFNLTAAEASDILGNAESHLGAMAVPYILGTHEDYMKACLRLVERHTSSHLGTKNLRSVDQHEKLEGTSTTKFSPDTLTQFHLVRKMRNCTVHAGGLADKRVENHCKRMSERARRGWENITGYEPDFRAGQDKITFTHRETAAALAITRNLALQANEILQMSIPRAAWGEILMRDLDEFGPGLPKDPSERIKKVRGYARHYYSALRFTEQEVVAFDAGYTK